MNLGIILVGMLLLGGSVLGIIMIASQNQTVYVDTFGDIQSNETNTSQSLVTNTTSPLMGAGGGLLLVFAAILIFVVGIFFVSTMKSAGGRR
jgi:hypothetical protein